MHLWYIATSQRCPLEHCTGGRQHGCASAHGHYYSSSAAPLQRCHIVHPNWSLFPLLHHAEAMVPIKLPALAYLKIPGLWQWTSIKGLSSAGVLSLSPIELGCADTTVIGQCMRIWYLQAPGQLKTTWPA